APAERGHERLPQRDEAERAEARPEIGDGDRAPARSGVPARGEDQVRLAAERAEGEAAGHTEGRHGERAGDDPRGQRKSATPAPLGWPGVRHPARSTRRCASAAAIDCRGWGGSIGFVTWSKAPNARLRLASWIFTLSFSMITCAAGTSATIAGSTPTPLSPGISTSSSTRWGALSPTARTPLAASLMRRTS